MAALFFVLIKFAIAIELYALCSAAATAVAARPGKQCTVCRLARPAAWLKESVSINLQCIYKSVSPSVDDVRATIDGKNLITDTNISIYIIYE